MEEQKTTEVPPVQTPPAAEASSAQQDGGASSNKDVEDNKALAIIGYILPILFFVPLITDAKNSPFAKFHSNQQLNLLLAAIAVNIVGGVIPILGWFIILPFGSLAILVLMIIGIINSAKGEMKKLPLIGGFNLIK